MASLLVTIMQPTVSLAEFDLDEEIDAELSRLYSGSSASSSGVTAASGGSSSESSNSVFSKDISATDNQMAPIKMNGSSGSSPNIQINVQTSPQTQVSSGAVSKNKTEQSSDLENSEEMDNSIVSAGSLGTLKKSRKNMESTNDRIVVEKLEESRIEDEKTRTEKIFGAKKEALDSSTEQVLLIHKETHKETKKDDLDKEFDREELKNEIRQSLKEDNDEDLKGSNKTYFSTLVGMGDYPDVKNVRGSYSLGVAFGQKVKNKMIVEGAFLFSEFDVEQRDGGYICDNYSYSYYGSACVQYPRITRMNQYQTSAALKYQFLEGAIRPHVGSLIAYTYRTFSDVQFALPNNDAQSHAIDLAFLSGLDVEVSSDFSLGVDFKYYYNLTSRSTNSGLQQSFSRSVLNSDKSIEGLNYTQFGVTAKFNY